MLSYSSVLRLLAAGFVISLALLCVSTAGAQSGRRAKPIPPPVATPEATPTAAKPVDKPEPIKFIVGLDRYGSFSTIHLSTYSGVVQSCAQRLEEPETVKVEAAQDDLTRSDAIKRAKGEKEAYVVWMRIRPDVVGDDNGSSGNFSETYIEYTVFAPTTAKQVTTGNAYPAAYRNSSVILKPSSVYGDRLFNEAAREVADKILAHFHVGLIKPGP